VEIEEMWKSFRLKAGGLPVLRCHGVNPNENKAASKLSRSKKNGSGLLTHTPFDPKLLIK